MGSLTEALRGFLDSASILAFPLAFAGGVLTSFTPCVYPMVPITVAYIGGRSEGSRSKGFVLSSAYVLGIAVTYSVLGAFAALTGRIFGYFTINAWVFGAVGAICVALGLSMLDVWEIRLPQWLQRGGDVSAGMSRGAAGAFGVGLASGFVAAPCTAPVLGVLLTLVASRQNVIYGVGLLFAFALGLGFLLMLVGTFTGALTSLPQSGSWMRTIKKGFGVAILGVAGYFFYSAGQLI
jgi:thiol:disulfide interchange protein DsbD